MRMFTISNAVNPTKLNGEARHFFAPSKSPVQKTRLAYMECTIIKRMINRRDQVDGKIDCNRRFRSRLALGASNAAEGVVE